MTNLSAFARLLDEGLARRDLTLHRVVQHLARRGQTVSASTLSLWRRGRTRPSAQRSGELLTALEQVLRLEPGSLLRALDEPDVGAPDWWAQRVPIHEFDDAEQALEEFRRATGLDQPDDLDRVRVHTQVDVDLAGDVERIVHNAVLRAARDGARRLGVYHFTDFLTADGQPSLFELDRVLGGQVVQQVEFGHLGASAAVIELDEILTKGEMTHLVVEWVRVTDPPPKNEGGDFFEARSPWPVGRVSVEACFAGPTPATARSWAVSTLGGHARLTDTPAQELGPSHCIQAHAEDVVGGGVRLQWTWAPEDNQPIGPEQGESCAGDDPCGGDPDG